MLRVEKTVFISYRRTSKFIALSIYQHLTSQGYDVFFDYNSIHSGDFEQNIFANITARAHFIVLLSNQNYPEITGEISDWIIACNPRPDFLLIPIP